MTHSSSSFWLAGFSVPGCGFHNVLGDQSGLSIVPAGCGLLRPVEMFRVYA